MKYTARVMDSRDIETQLYSSLEPVAKGLGMVILELSLFRRKGRGSSPGSVQIRVTAYKKGTMGVDDCSLLHRAILPRLELAFPGIELYLEVSSPGIGRLIKDGSEMIHFIGRGIKCYRAADSDINGDSNGSAGKDSVKPDGSGWISGILKEADEKGVVLDTVNGKIALTYENIAKAKLSETEYV